MTDRETVLQEIDHAESELRRRLDRIDEAHGTWQGAVGDWSVLQLLHHIHGWLAEMNIAVERMRQGQRPTPDGVSYDDFNAWNVQFVRDRADQPWSAARAAFETEHARFRQNIAAVDPARFGPGKTINQLIGGTVTHHYIEHCQDLDAYLGGDSP